jgi:rare lipoprotein A
MRRRKAVTIAAIGAPPFAACIGACGRRIPATALAALLAAALTACSSGGSSLDSNLGVSASPRVSGGRMIAKGGGIYKVGLPYRVGGRWYHPRENPNYDRVGTASWYGTAFHGRRTSNGEVYNMYALTAGHPTLPMPSYAYVTNLQNGRTALVRINDRGPYARDRLIDLSYQTAHTLGFHNHGLARVRVRYAGRAPLNGDDSAERRHLAAQTWYRGSQRAVSDSTASIPTGSVRLVRTLDVRPTGQAQAPSWSVAEYRQGELASARQAESILSRPAADTYLRVGPFASRAEAGRLRYMLAGPDASAIEASGSRDDPAYRVRLGPYDEPDAATAMARISAAGFEPEASVATGQGAEGYKR